MNNVKEKLLTKMSDLFENLTNLEKDLQDSLTKANAMDKENLNKSVIVDIGNKSESYRGLLNKFFTTLEVYTDIYEGSVNDLPESQKSFYLTYVQLSSPLSEKDNEEVKKFKEQLKNIKLQ